MYRLLEDGPTGFSALKREIDGTSSKTLAESLDHLEAAGIVRRAQLNEQPVRVEYRLTKPGRSLDPVIVELITWGTNTT